MKNHPPSAVSLFTAFGAAAIFVVGVIAVVARHWAPVYLLLWFIPLLGIIGFSVWASRGSRGR
jgi:hypothetical protein